MTADAITLPRVMVRSRVGRCYELCGRGLFDHPTWLLVHGEVRSREPGGRTGHAWLLSRDGSVIYDAVTDTAKPADEYMAWVAAVERARYDIKQAAEAVCTAGHWGPWEVDE